MKIIAFIYSLVSNAPYKRWSIEYTWVPVDQEDVNNYQFNQEIEWTKHTSFPWKTVVFQDEWCCAFYFHLP